MAKELRCAQCGTILNSSLKGIPQLGAVIEVVEPHVCLETIADFTVPPITKPKLERIEDARRLDAFPFCQKLTEVRKAAVSAYAQFQAEDKREKRIELDATSAPLSLLSAIGKFDFDEGGEMEG